MAYADTIRTTDYTREELANLIDGNRFVGEAVTTTGTAPNYEVTLTPAPSAYFQGMTFLIKIHSNLATTAGATLNVNGLGAKPLKTVLVDTSTRDLFFFELNNGVEYLVTYDASLNLFRVANPTYGTAVQAYTPTVASSSGSLALGGSNDCWYQYIGARQIRVHIQVQLGLSGATASDLYISLPTTTYNQDWNTFGIGYVTGLSGYASYGAEAFINTSNQIQLRRTDQQNWAIDTSFFIYCTMFYMQG